MRNTPTAGLHITLPDLGMQYPTFGPVNRYGAILYVEKEGFLPLLRKDGLAERYDMAIMSSKGMGTTAVRTLIENLSGRVQVLVLHDFDKSGFSIVGTLTRDTRRYAYKIAPEVIDLGLRLKDVQAWNLPAEDVFNDSDPTENLLENGATAEEVAFLRGEPAHHVGQKRRYKGRRVELNAFTSDQFLRWLESKLEEHAVTKVIPDDATLEQAFRRAAGLRKFRVILENALTEVEGYAEGAKLPDNLRERLRKELELRPCQSWDDAIEASVPPVEQEGF